MSLQNAADFDTMVCRSQNSEEPPMAISVPPTGSGILPADACLINLSTLPDERGEFTEIHRNEWHTAPRPVQWSLSRSRAGCLRGVHVHARHWDYILVVTGRMWVALHDLRPESQTYGLTSTFELAADRLQMALIPPGVAHGFCYEVEADHLNGTSRYYDPCDHMKCIWNSPELAIDWPMADPLISEADTAAMDYVAFTATFLAAWDAVTRGH